MSLNMTPKKCTHNRTVKKINVYVDHWNSMYEESQSNLAKGNSPILKGGKQYYDKVITMLEDTRPRWSKIEEVLEFARRGYEDMTHQTRLAQHCIHCIPVLVALLLTNKPDSSSFWLGRDVQKEEEHTNHHHTVWIECWFEGAHYNGCEGAPLA